MPLTPRLALVVDDQPTNRLLAATLLKRWGWTVLEAESGEAALLLSSEHAFRLVLLDIPVQDLHDRGTLQSAMRVGAHLIGRNQAHYADHDSNDVHPHRQAPICR